MWTDRGVECGSERDVERDSERDFECGLERDIESRSEKDVDCGSERDVRCLPTPVHHHFSQTVGF